MPSRSRFQMPVRSMTLTTLCKRATVSNSFQMPVRSMTLTTTMYHNHWGV